MTRVTFKGSPRIISQSSLWLEERNVDQTAPEKSRARKFPNETAFLSANPRPNRRGWGRVSLIIKQNKNQPTLVGARARAGEGRGVAS